MQIQMIQETGDRHMELRKSMLPEQLGQGAGTVLIMLIKEL